MLSPDHGSPTKLAVWFESLPFRSDFRYEHTEDFFTWLDEADFTWENVRDLWYRWFRDDRYGYHSTNSDADRFVFLHAVLDAFRSSLSWGGRYIVPPPAPPPPEPTAQAVAAEMERLRAEEYAEGLSDEDIRRFARAILSLRVSGPPAEEAFSVPLSDFCEMCWFWACYADVCISLERPRDAAMVFPVDFDIALDIWDSDKGWMMDVQQDLDWALVNALAEFKYLEGYFSALHDSGGQLAADVTRQIADIKAAVQRQAAVQSAHMAATLEVGALIQRQAAVQRAQLAATLRVGEIVEFDRSVANRQRELLADWTRTHSEREEQELSAACAGLVGQAAWKALYRDSQSNLRFFVILKQQWKPEDAPFAALALCMTFERELGQALRRDHVYKEFTGLKETLDEAERQEGRLGDIGRRGRVGSLAGLRNKAAHGGAFSDADLSAVEGLLLSQGGKSGLIGLAATYNKL